MSDIDLSFEQLRQDIFEGVMESLGRNSYSTIHTALMYNRDPQQLILPTRDDAMLIGQYGMLSLKFDIPNSFPLYFNIVLTLGRLNYSISASRSLAGEIDLKASLTDLAQEMGIKLGVREVHDEVRFEFCNDPTLVWAPTAINILRSTQLENAFKEFVRLQADRLIVSVAGILATSGIFHDVEGGLYVTAMVSRMGRRDYFEQIVCRDYHVVSEDLRDPLNEIYGLRAKETQEDPLAALSKLQAELKESGYTAALRPAWGFNQHNPRFSPLIVEKTVEVEKLVQVETVREIERLVEVEVQPPPLDYLQLLTEPRVDD